MADLDSHVYVALFEREPQDSMAFSIVPKLKEKKKYFLKHFHYPDVASPSPISSSLSFPLPKATTNTKFSHLYVFFFPLFFSFLLTQLNSFFLLLCSALLSLFPRSRFFLVFSSLSFNFPRNTLMVFAFFCSLSAFSEYSLSGD